MDKNTYDTKDQELQLQSLTNELQQAEKSLESNFAKYLSDTITPEDEELFFENKEQFFKKILDIQNEYFYNEIQSRRDKIEALQGDVEKKRAYADIQTAQEAFLAKNPDVDIKAMLEFYSEDLPKRKQDELDSLKPSEFFDRLYSMYKNKDTQKQENPKIPKSYQGAPVDATAISNSKEDDTYMGRL